MKFSSARALVSGSLLLLLSVAGCGGSGDDATVDLAGSEPSTESQPQTTAVVQDDENSQSSGLQCDGADFDIAELVFTESDRQWYCSVSSSPAVSSDEVFFSRNGTAWFSQYGQVYWNRNITDDTLTVASPLISTMSIKEINSANTTLQFKLGDGVTNDALYDCVLVQRDDVS